MSINRGVDKEDVIYTYNGILFSYKKEWNNVICNNMDGPRDCHTKWSQTENDKYPHIAYMWNLRIWHKWTYLQNNNRVTNAENKLMVTGGKRRDKLED